MPISRNIRQNSDFTHIMIHHSEQFVPVKGKQMNDAFVQNGSFGLPYDIVINSNGKYDLTPRWIRAISPTQYVENVPIYNIFKYPLHDISSACGEQQMNYKAIHIALLGNFNVNDPTIAQLQSLEKLIIQIHNKIPSVRTVIYHSDIVSLSCPGIRFPNKSNYQKLLDTLVITSEIFEPLPAVSTILSTYIDSDFYYA